MSAVKRVAISLLALATPLLAEDDLPPADDSTPFVGIVLSRAAADIAARHAGPIIGFQVDVGDTVAAGDTLFTLDADEIGHQLARARADLASRSADRRSSLADRREADARLARRTAVPDAFPAEAVEEARHAVERAVAELDAAEARLVAQRAYVRELESSLANAVGVAPFGGIIAVRYSDSGAFARVGDPILRIVNVEDLLVRFAVPEGAARGVTAGDDVTVRDGAGRTVTATVTLVSPELDIPSNTFFVEAHLDAGAAALRSGTAVRVGFATSRDP